MNKPTKKRRSFVTFAKADDPIYKEGWTITTVGVWGRPPKPNPELTKAVRAVSKTSDKEGTQKTRGMWMWMGPGNGKGVGGSFH